MSKSTHRLIKLVKAKYEHACMVHDTVENTDAFVEKYIYEYRGFLFKIHTWRQIEILTVWFSGILALLGASADYLYYGAVESVYQYIAVGAAEMILLEVIRRMSDEPYKIHGVKMYMIDYLDNICAVRQRRQRVTEKEELNVIASANYGAAEQPEKKGETVAAKPDVKEREKKVHEIMDVVGLAERTYSLYPHELDGGRRQRVGIARALILDPKLVVCDEPVSALDVSIQAQILNLMMELQKERNLTYLFITHNLSVVKHISDDITVMYLGQMVEKAGSSEIFAHQYHPYTKALISAIPLPKYNAPDNQIILKGEITSPINVTKSCRFAPRCIYAKPECFNQEPALEEVEPGHFVKCHFVREINGL